jgi:hypothetical protein
MTKPTATIKKMSMYLLISLMAVGFIPQLTHADTLVSPSVITSTSDFFEVDCDGNDYAVSVFAPDSLAGSDSFFAGGTRCASPDLFSNVVAYNAFIPGTWSVVVWNDSDPNASECGAADSNPLSDYLTLCEGSTSFVSLLTFTVSFVSPVVESTTSEATSTVDQTHSDIVSGTFLLLFGVVFWPFILRRS